MLLNFTIELVSSTQSNVEAARNPVRFIVIGYENSQPISLLSSSLDPHKPTIL